MATKDLLKMQVQVLSFSTFQRRWIDFEDMEFKEHRYGIHSPIEIKH